jgi:hypothetical protein
MCGNTQRPRNRAQTQYRSTGYKYLILLSHATGKLRRAARLGKIKPSKLQCFPSTPPPGGEGKCLQAVCAAALLIILWFSLVVAQAGQVTLAWNASSGPVAGYFVYYGIASGNYFSVEDVGNSTTYTIANLTNSATYYFAVRAYDSAGNQSGFSNEVSTIIGVPPPPNGWILPSPWLGMDIGNVGLVGNAAYFDGTFSLQGAGDGIRSMADAFYFVYQPLTGDGSIMARVASLANTNGWAAAGVMIRENLDANARHALVAVTPENGTYFIYRMVAPGGDSDGTQGTVVTAPYWVKLTRAGDTFIAHQSADGSNWMQISSAVTISMAPSAYVGLALTSHNNEVLNTATLNNVSVSTGGASNGDSATTLITHYYVSILERQPEADGLAFWQGLIADRQAAGVDVKPVFRDMANFLLNSPEYLGRNTSDGTFVHNLYRTFYQREPDAGGLAFWLAQLGTGSLSRNQVIAHFLYLPEFLDFMRGLGF